MGAALRQSLLGMAVGARIIYFILRAGKLLFGRQKMTLPADTRIIFSETAVHLPDEEIPYEDLFYRQSDVDHPAGAHRGTGGPLLQGCAGAAEPGHGCGSARKN